MRQAAILAILALALTLVPPAGARAQGVTDPDCFPFAPGCEGLPRLLDDLSRDLLPFLDEFTGRADPLLRQLREMLGDLSGWEAPEILPDGDILIRRRRAPEGRDHRPQEAPPARPRDRDADDQDAPASEPFEL